MDKEKDIEETTMQEPEMGEGQEVKTSGEEKFDNPFAAPEAQEGGAPTKRELWMVLAIIVVLLAVLILQRR